jgi:ABC-type transport system substrate-binding protein
LQGAPHKTAGGIPWSAIAALVGVVMIVLAVVSQLIMNRPVPPCGVSCPVPHPPVPPPSLGPSGPPLPAQSVYTSSTYGYRVEYPPDSDPSQTAQSLSWENTLGDGSQFEILFQAAPANGQTAQQIASALQQNLAPGATLVFNITGAELGSTDGYGNVYDGTVSPPDGQAVHSREVVEVAIHNGVAVELYAESTFVADKNDHPSPAELDPAIEQFTDQVGNTVTWQGEAPI